MADGQYATSHFEDFYNRVYTLDAPVTFGEIVEPTQRDVRVWNAYMATIQITSIVAEYNDEILLEGPAPVANILGLDVVRYTFTSTVLTAGEINARYTFSYSDATAASFTATGARFKQVKYPPTRTVSGVQTKLWPFEHNWREDFQIAYEFSTEVHQSRNKNEQRVAWRQTPRKRIETRAFLHRHGLTIMQSLMARWGSRAFMVPQAHRKVRLGAAAIAGSVFFDVASVPTWLTAGAEIAITDGLNWEQVTVQSVAGNSVFLFSVLANNFPDTALVYYTTMCRLENEQSAVLRSDRLAERTLQFTELPGENHDEFILAAGTLFDGREFLPVDDHNWADDVDLSFGNTSDVVDFGLGVTDGMFPVPFNTRTSKLAFRTKTQSAAEELRSFFFRHRGQQKDFWVESITDDIPLKASLLTGATILRSGGRFIFDAFNGVDTHKALVFKMKDGSKAYFKIASMAVVASSTGDETQITLSGSVGLTINANNVERVSWLFLSRFATDTLEQRWNTDQSCDMTLPTYTLEYKAPE